jgi:hypothetical protein
MGKKRKRAGRPPKSWDRRKSESMLIRLEPSEKIAFSDAAEVAGQDLSTWVRARLRQAAARELESADRPIPFLRHLETD